MYDKNKITLSDDGTGTYTSLATLSNGSSSSEFYQTQDLTWEQSGNKVTIVQETHETSFELKSGEEGDTMSSEKITYTRYDITQEPIIGSYDLMITLAYSGQYIGASGSIEFNDDGTFLMVVNDVSYAGNWEATGESDSSIDVSRVGYSMLQKGKVLSTAWYTDKESGKGYEIVIPLEYESTGLYLFFSKTE